MYAPVLQPFVMARASSVELGLKKPTPMRPRLGSELVSNWKRKKPSPLLGSQLLVWTRASSTPPVRMCRPSPSVWVARSMSRTCVSLRTRGKPAVPNVMPGYSRVTPGSSGDSLWLHNSRFNESSLAHDDGVVLGRRLERPGERVPERRLFGWTHGYDVEAVVDALSLVAHREKQLVALDRAAQVEAELGTAVVRDGQRGVRGQVFPLGQVERPEGCGLDIAEDRAVELIGDW